MNINCSKCGAFLGELSKGKIHNKASFLCSKCMEYYKTCESLADYKKNTDTSPSMPDFFNDLMKGIKK